MAWIVIYQHPGLGERRSSIWGSRTDADNYAGTKPAAWRARVEFTRRTPEIFRHCGPNDDQRNPSQAIGGRCFHCGHVLTRADARRFDERTNEGREA